MIKIKFEVDINPPKYATFEHKYRLLPAPYEVKLYDEASLFAGKIHAVICRAWKSRVKGGDIPMGFGLSLAANAESMEAFSRMSDAEKEAAVEKSRQMHTRTNM